MGFFGVRCGELTLSQWPPDNMQQTSIGMLPDGQLNFSQEIVLSRLIANTQTGAVGNWNITGRSLCGNSINGDLFAELRLNNSLLNSANGSMLVDIRSNSERADGLVMRANGVIGFNIGSRGFWTFVFSSSSNDVMFDGISSKLGANQSLINEGSLILYWNSVNRTARAARSAFVPSVSGVRELLPHVVNITVGGRAQADPRLSIWGRWESDFCIDRWIVSIDSASTTTTTTQTSTPAPTFQSTPRTPTSISTTATTETIETTTRTTTNPDTNPDTTMPTSIQGTMSTFPNDTAANSTETITETTSTTSTTPSQITNPPDVFDTDAILGIVGGVLACAILFVIVGVLIGRSRRPASPTSPTSQDQTITVVDGVASSSQYGTVPRSRMEPPLYDVGNIQ